jgi:hypothetical protein
MKKTLGQEHRRRRALEEAPAMIASGCTLQQAADALNLPYQTLWRWLDQLGKTGGDVGAVAHGKRTGRPPVALLTEDEACAVRARVKGGMSEVMALRIACHEGEIRGEVAAMLMGRKNKHSIPAAIRRQIHVPGAVKTYHHSPRDFRLKHLSTPRRNAVVKDGEETPDEAGDVFVSDDMTVNFGWWTPWPFADCECSRKWGVKVTRGQLLATIDLVSLKFLHFALLVRNGESYRANDIWAEYGRIFRGVGLPRKEIIHEGGNWESKHIHGHKIEIAGADEELRVGGIARLGVKTTRSWSPKTKPIESRFDFLQTAMEGLPGNLGREKEGRKEWQIYNRCAAGIIDPRAKLPSQREMADKIAELMAFLDGEPMTGRVKGVPDEIWNASITAKPLRTPPPDMGWVFARDARLLTIPAKGPLKCKFKQTSGDEELCFDATEFIFLPRGLKVMAHFDPLETAGEAVLISADTRSFELPPMDGRPPRQVRMGDVVCVARRADSSPRSSDVADANSIAQKAKATAVRTESRRIDANKSRATKMAEAYDGFGQAMRVESNGEACGTAAAALPMAPPRPPREIVPAVSSRPLPAGVTRAEEIARLRARLEEAEC